jgi:S-adenosylmethionine:tRNA ribosyltransferase-isomerase
MLKTSDFNYTLPEELIAQHPPEKRGDSRMLVLDKSTGLYEAKKFKNFIDYVEPGDCLVTNNTKVINARFFGLKENTGAKIEILLTMPLNESQSEWKCFIKPGKRVRSGTKIILNENNFSTDPETLNTVKVTVEKKRDDGAYEISFDSPIDYTQKFFGHTPLPPYIKRKDSLKDSTRYQTVFAKNSGAVAAPTAGLHFSDSDLMKLKKMNINMAEVTLHVGPGTFKPVEVNNPAEHKMHSEVYTLSKNTADIINNTIRNGGKIIAIGTTSVRVLETCADENGFVIPSKGETDIFLYPPAKPKIVDMLLTNFHLPKSTLLMLVSIFADRETVLNAYQFAVEQKFRFYSYGDCMLIR